MIAITRWYDGWELAGRRADFAAKVPASAFERVAQALGNTLAEPGGEVDAAVEFSREGRLLAVRGECLGTLRLVCQRCLEVYALPIRSEFSILAAESEGMLAWASQGEARETMLVEGRVRPLDFVEEELLLALPLVPKHSDPAACVDLRAWTESDTP